MNRYITNATTQQSFETTHISRLWLYPGSIKLSTILSGQELLASREFWPHVGPVHCSCGPAHCSRGSHVGPVHCLCGSHVLFRWDPHGPTYYLGGAHIIFKFNSMLPSLPTLPFLIFMFFSFLILIIDIQKIKCNTILIFFPHLTTIN